MKDRPKIGLTPRKIGLISVVFNFEGSYYVTGCVFFIGLYFVTIRILQVCPVRFQSLFTSRARCGRKIGYCFI